MNWHCKLGEGRFIGIQDHTQETRHHPPHHSLIVIMRVGVVVVAVLVVLCLVAGSTCVNALFEPKATLAGSVACS